MSDEEPVDVLAVLNTLLHSRRWIEHQGMTLDFYKRLQNTRAAIAELLVTQVDTLRMLEADHRSSGLWNGNKRIQRAKDAINRCKGVKL